MSEQDNKPNIDFSIQGGDSDSDSESLVGEEISNRNPENTSDDGYGSDNSDDDDNSDGGDHVNFDGGEGTLEDSNIEYNEIKNTNNDLTDDDDDEDLEEDYLQKIDKTKYNEVLETYHPELKIHNIDEIKTLSIVLRDKDNNIIDPLHKTIPFITSYEKARIIGERTKQLNQGAKPFTEVEPDVIDGYLIALKEYKEKKIPFIIQRPLPNGTSEYWKFSDLEDI